MYIYVYIHIFIYLFIFYTVDDITPAFPATKNYGNYGLLLIVGNAGFIINRQPYDKGPHATCALSGA